jgi:cytochrome P450
VRVAPNDLSFITPSSFRDINVKTPTRKTFIKTEFYDVLTMGFEEAGIASERSVEKHVRKRKLLAPPFAPASMHEFEPVVHRHINELCEEIEKIGKTPEGIDMTPYFHFLVFDIAGSFVYSEDFGAVKAGMLVLAATVGYG